MARKSKLGDSWDQTEEQQPVPSKTSDMAEEQAPEAGKEGEAPKPGRPRIDKAGPLRAVATRIPIDTFERLSSLSEDSRAPLSEIVRKAVERGLDELEAEYAVEAQERAKRLQKRAKRA